MSVSSALRTAGVSRNAYYSLCRRTTILPHTVTALANLLGVEASDILDVDGLSCRDAENIMRQTARIARAHPEADPDNIRHTLLLLRLEPVERLRRALTRGKLERIIASKKAVGRDKDKLALRVLSDAIAARSSNKRRSRK